jgi:hypothetical protein
LCSCSPPPEEPKAALKLISGSVALTPGAGNADNLSFEVTDTADATVRIQALSLLLLPDSVYCETLLLNGHDRWHWTQPGQPRAGESDSMHFSSADSVLSRDTVEVKLNHFNTDSIGAGTPADLRGRELVLRFSDGSQMNLQAPPQEEPKAALILVPGSVALMPGAGGADNLSFEVTDTADIAVQLHALSLLLLPDSVYCETLLLNGYDRWHWTAPVQPRAGEGDTMHFSSADSVLSRDTVKVEMNHFNTDPIGAGTPADLRGKQLAVLFSDGSQIDLQAPPHVYGPLKLIIGSVEAMPGPSGVPNNLTFEVVNTGDATIRLDTLVFRDSSGFAYCETLTLGGRLQWCWSLPGVPRAGGYAAMPFAQSDSVLGYARTRVRLCGFKTNPLDPAEPVDLHGSQFGLRFSDGSPVYIVVP